jgi:hypothetical protein
MKEEGRDRVISKARFYNAAKFRCPWNGFPDVLQSSQLSSKGMKWQKCETHTYRGVCGEMCSY